MQPTTASPERLRKLAADLRARGEAEEGRDRLENTHKRRTEAAAMRDRAREQLRMADTLDRLAAEQAAGRSTHLAGVRSVTHVEALDRVIRSALRRQADAQDTRPANARGYGTRKPLELHDLDLAFVRMPHPRVLAEHLVSAYAGQPAGAGVDSLRQRAKRAKADEVLVITTPAELAELRRLSKHKENHYTLGDTVTAYDRVVAMGLDDETKLRAAIGEYLACCRGEARKASPLEVARRQVAGLKIPGFVSTPAPAADRLVLLAAIPAGARVLEPEAGKGDLVEAILRSAPSADIEVIERNYSLRELLTLQGLKLVADDMLAFRGGPYDRVVMNPPFEDGQDIEHVRHAFELLKPGGRLAAIVSEGPFYRQDRRSQEFRAWLEELGAHVEKLPDHSFRTSAQPTDVAARIVVIDKPATTRAAGRADYEERRERRIESLEARAAQKHGEADALWERSHQRLAHIPMGQPILVGHHSERRHRRDIERANADARRSIDTAQQAAELAHRAEAAATSTAISSDDPDALDKLKAKLTQLEADRARWKEINKAVRKKDPKAALAALGLNPAQVEKFLTPDFAGRIGVPDYQLTNSGAEARRLEARIAALEARASQATPADHARGEFRATWDSAENRVAVYSPYVADKAARAVKTTRMRSEGFVWSPSNERWQRQASAQAWHRAVALVDSLAGAAEPAVPAAAPSPELRTVQTLDPESPASTFWPSEVPDPAATTPATPTSALDKRLAAAWAERRWLPWSPGPRLPEYRTSVEQARYTAAWAERTAWTVALDHTGELVKGSKQDLALKFLAAPEAERRKQLLGWEAANKDRPWGGLDTLRMHSAIVAADAAGFAVVPDVLAEAQRHVAAVNQSLNSQSGQAYPLDHIDPSWRTNLQRLAELAGVRSAGERGGPTEEETMRAKTEKPDPDRVVVLLAKAYQDARWMPWGPRPLDPADNEWWQAERLAWSNALGTDEPSNKALKFLLLPADKRRALVESGKSVAVPDGALGRVVAAAGAAGFHVEPQPDVLVDPTWEVKGSLWLSRLQQLRERTLSDKGPKQDKAARLTEAGDRLAPLIQALDDQQAREFHVKGRRWLVVVDGNGFATMTSDGGSIKTWPDAGAAGREVARLVGPELTLFLADQWHMTPPVSTVPNAERREPADFVRRVVGMASDAAGRPPALNPEEAGPREIAGLDPPPPATLRADLTLLWQQAYQAARLWLTKKPTSDKQLVLWDRVRSAALQAGRGRPPPSFKDAAQAVKALGASGRPFVELWIRYLAQGITETRIQGPLTSAPDAIAVEEARMGELLRRGRDDEESRWAAAVDRGTAVERARGLAPEAARKGAIPNLAKNIDHYPVSELSERTLRRQREAREAEEEAAVMAAEMEQHAGIGDGLRTSPPVAPERVQRARRAPPKARTTAKGKAKAKAEADRERRATAKAVAAAKAARAKLDAKLKAMRPKHPAPAKLLALVKPPREQFEVITQADGSVLILGQAADVDRLARQLERGGGHVLRGKASDEQTRDMEGSMTARLNQGDEDAPRVWDARGRDYLLLSRRGGPTRATLDARRRQNKMDAPSCAALVRARGAERNLRAAQREFAAAERRHLRATEQLKKARAAGGGRKGANAKS